MGESTLEIARHPGARFIIGGMSQFALTLDPAFLETGFVIGLNTWPKVYQKTDYWLCCDTDLAMRDYPDLVRSIQCPKFMQAYDHIPDAPADYWFRKERDYIPLTWQEKLNWSATSACAAVNLAVIMGAKEIYLFGVDLIPGGRADGTEYGKPDHWGRYVQDVSRWIQEIMRLSGIPVYKTNPASPLEVQFIPTMF